MVITPKVASEVRRKLGYLNTGDAVRMTSELDRLKGKGEVQVSFDDGVKETFHCTVDVLFHMELCIRYL